MSSHHHMKVTILKGVTIDNMKDGTSTDDLKRESNVPN